MNSVNQNRHQIQTIQFFLAQLLQLRRAGLHEFAAHAGFFDPVAFHHALHCTPIVPRSQSRNDAFPHRALPPSVVLQPRVTLQFHFLASACAHTRSFHRHLPPPNITNPGCLPQRTAPDVGSGRCGGPTRRVTSFSRIAPTMRSPASPVNSSTWACSSSHTSTIGSGTSSNSSRLPSTSNFALDLSGIP